MMYYTIYETTNNINGRKYRGCHSTDNLDDGYLGSGVYFLNAVDRYGEENFSKEILELCDSFEDMVEKEKIYVDQDWVNREDTYNLQTGGMSNGILCEESKKKISETLKEGYKSGRIIPPALGKKRPPLTEQQKKYLSDTMIEYWKKNKHPSFGKSINKGIKRNKPSWNKGKKLGPMPQDEKDKRSKTLLEYYKDKPGNRKNQEPWNKGTKGLVKGHNKGSSTERVDCPNCGKNVDIYNAKRWHFDNCSRERVEKEKKNKQCKLVFKQIDDKNYECFICGSIHTKKGIYNHFWAKHEDSPEAKEIIEIRKRNGYYDNK